MPVYEVKYKDGNSNKLAWVIGLQRKVIAPEYPVEMKRVVPFWAACALCPLAVILFIVWSIFLRPLGL